MFSPTSHLLPSEKEASEMGKEAMSTADRITNSKKIPHKTGFRATCLPTLIAMFCYYPSRLTNVVSTTLAYIKSTSHDGKKQNKE